MTRYLSVWVKSKRRFRLVKIIAIYLCADKEKKKVCIFYTHNKHIFVFFLFVCVFTGPVCGKLDASQKNVTFKSNEVTVIFKSGLHRSGRGFLLSYTTDQNPGIVTLLLWFCFMYHRFPNARFVVQMELKKKKNPHLHLYNGVTWATTLTWIFVLFLVHSRVCVHDSLLIGIQPPSQSLLWHVCPEKRLNGVRPQPPLCQLERLDCFPFHQLINNCQPTTIICLSQPRGC